MRQRLATRGAGDEARIDKVLTSDELRRKLLAEVEALKAERKRVSKEWRTNAELGAEEPVVP